MSHRPCPVCVARAAPAEALLADTAWAPARRPGCSWMGWDGGRMVGRVPRVRTRACEGQAGAGPWREWDGVGGGCWWWGRKIGEPSWPRPRPGRRTVVATSTIKALRARRRYAMLCMVPSCSPICLWAAARWRRAGRPPVHAARHCLWFVRGVLRAACWYRASACYTQDGRERAGLGGICVMQGI